MAFDIDYLARVSSSANRQGLKVWTYNGTSTGTNEAVATIVASGYFNGLQQNLTSGSEAGPLNVGDVMHIHGNDANGMYVVTSVTTNVTVATYAAIGSINSAQVVDTLIQHAQVDLTLAEFIATYTTSQELVAAPGANKKLILHRASLWIDYGGTVLADGGAMHIQYDSTANGAGTKATGTQAAATLIAATADTSLGFSPVDTTLVDSATLNKGLYLAMATQDLTGGDASAYKVDCWYSVQDVS